MSVHRSRYNSLTIQAIILGELVNEDVDRGIEVENLGLELGLGSQGIENKDVRVSPPPPPMARIAE